MRKESRIQRNPNLKTFTVTIEYPEGKKVEDSDVYRIETDLWIDGRQYAITTYHVNDSPKVYNLVDGVTIKFTEEHVETP